MLLLDTHALLWMGEEPAILGAATQLLIHRARPGESVAVSAFTFWEIAFLIAKRRLGLNIAAETYRSQVLARGVRELPVTGDIGIAAVSLADLHGDPADRIIVATALMHDATLITADRRLLDWSGALKSHDARL